jgi:prenyltransferase beta subunit
MNSLLATALVVTFTALSIGLPSSRAEPPATTPAPGQQQRAREKAQAPPDAAEAVKPTQAAASKGLEWLASHQNADGTFGEQSLIAGTTAAPALAVMAFISAGHVPGKGPYGEVMNKSIDYVLAGQQDSGLLSRHPNANGTMYEHGINTLMAAKCYPLIDQERKFKSAHVLKLSVALLLEAQQYNGKSKRMPYTGGWRYQPNSPDSDISVTGWQILALRAAEGCGMEVPKANLAAAHDYIRRSACPDGGFAYQPGGIPNQARTGIGVLTLELLRDLDPDLGPDDHAKEALAGGQYLINNPPDNPQMDFYYYGAYYCSQALNQLGGKYRKVLLRPKSGDGKRSVRDILLAQQEKDGSFRAGNPMELHAGPAYRTAMAILALCAPFDPGPTAGSKSKVTGPETRGADKAENTQRGK